MDNTKKDIAQGYAYYVDDEESVPGETIVPYLTVKKLLVLLR